MVCQNPLFIVLVFFSTTLLIFRLCPWRPAFSRHTLHTLLVSAYTVSRRGGPQEADGIGARGNRAVIVKNTGFRYTTHHVFKVDLLVVEVFMFEEQVEERYYLTCRIYQQNRQRPPFRSSDARILGVCRNASVGLLLELYFIQSYIKHRLVPFIWSNFPTLQH